VLIQLLLLGGITLLLILALPFTIVTAILQLSADTRISKYGV
jgi:hypothetical protein